MDSKEAGSSISSAITNMVLWMYVPGFVTSFLLKQYYSFKYAKNSPSIPKPNSLKHKRNYKLCYTLVIGIYFMYSIGQTIYSLEETYYSKIGIYRGCPRSDFKRKTRQLLLIYHPDKSSPGNTDQYHELKRMADVIENPNLCNIYDKFGESGVKTVLQASSKKNFASAEEVRKEYIYATFLEWITFYAGTVAMLLFVSIYRNSDSGYWKFVSLLILASYETFLYFVDFTTLETLSIEGKFNFKNPSTWISFILSRVPFFQRLIILRQISVNFGLAFSQLGPFWFASKADLFNDKKALLQEIENIQKISASDIFEESKYVFNSAFEPFETNEDMKSLLKRQMGQIVVDLKVLETMTAETSAESRKTR